MKKIIFALIVVALIAPMFIKGPDGEPIMEFSDWFPQKPEIVSQTGRSEPEYYRYRDSTGTWQYTDHPPEGVEYELVDVDTSVNNIQSTPLPASHASNEVQSTTPGIAGYMQDLQNVKQDAEQVQQIMDDREAQIDDMLRQAQ